MSTFLKLNAFTTEHSRQGVSVTNPSVTVELGNGTTVEFPAPFVPVSGYLAVVPAISADGETGVRADLSRWSPAYISGRLVVVFPVHFSDQATAVRAARAFDANPDTSWTDSFDQKMAWLREWGPENGVRP
ncbi:MAG: hypothetical protein WBA97_37470 [Actinophytocola sp.]|uniref:hypothetical protein n=1 Tax=Actinophytocola sp. TaxID=1872138 RepID=UPI003C786169